MSDDNWILYILFGAFVAWIFFFPTRYDSFKTITDYTLVCSGQYDSKSNICTGEWSHYDVRKYAASRQQQMVIENNFNGVTRLNNCEVYDVDNWYCNTRLMSAIYFDGCINGHCTASPDATGISHVSKWRYYIHVVIDWFNKPASS